MIPRSNNRTAAGSAAVLALLVPIGAFLAVCGPTGCASQAAGSGAAEVAGDDRRDSATRIYAVEQLWERAAAGEQSLGEARRLTLDLIWDRDVAPGARRRAVDLLLADTRPEALAHTAEVIRLMVPTEPSRDIVAAFALAAGRNGWRETTDGFVRRLAVDDSDLPLAERVEAAALRAMHPDRALEETLYDVFLRPTAPDGMDPTVGWPGRVRAAAWSVLSGLDTTGAVRTELLSRPVTNASSDAAALVGDLAALRRDLSVNIALEAEFDWLRSIRDGSEINAAWWAEATAAVAELDDAQRSGLKLRHVEPIRWAATHAPAWLDASKGELLRELGSRLDRETSHTRRADMGATRRRSRERLSDWRAGMVWADVLAALVAHEAVHTPGFAAGIWAQIEPDRKDRDTEYGGTIVPTDVGYRPILFIPRQRDRISDTQFVASSDLIASSDRALAHYHLQVQRRRNTSYAGPSEADLVYAERSGRTAIVFTSVGGDALNADYYQPDGVVIDLGEVWRP